jgi:signal transduction histidine kinase
VSGRPDAASLRSRLWASRWPEAAWLVFAAVNLAWMILTPAMAGLPFHLTWMSLLLLYGLGYRTWTPVLTWTLLVPVMTATGLLFVDSHLHGQGRWPYIEVLELPMMIIMLWVVTRHTSRRNAALARLAELSQRNAALLQRQRAFVQNASHELRTPITIALAHAELLQQAHPEAGPDAAVVADELGRLRRLADRLLLLATAEQPGALRLVPADLAALVGATLRRWEPVARQWLAGPCADLTVPADPDRLVVALDAIVDNAVRFTRPGDRIELSVRRSGDRAVITVADSGPGIPGGELGEVFERFSTAGPHRDTARNFGLGLSIVRAIAGAHGGGVGAARSPLGGAAITVWLPLREQPGSGPAADSLTAAGGGAVV